MSKHQETKLSNKSLINFRKNTFTDL